MKESKFLITVTNEEMLNWKVKNINFLFPIEGYSVGFLKTFSIEEIKLSNSFLYINRILDKEAIEKLKEDLKHISEKIIGICFTDLGVIRIVKELGLHLKLIYMQNHNTTNASSINYYLEEVDSVLVSTDITKEEIFTILNRAKKPLVLPYFMRVEAMYSRRTLLANYERHFDLEKENTKTLHEEISKMDFLAVENPYGTVLYTNKFIDYRSMKHENVLYYYINPIGLDNKTIESVLKGQDLSSISDSGFLNKETYYRLKEDCL